MPLEEYRRKRDFAKTPEPAPGQPVGSGPAAIQGVRRRFVVQRHRATRLHYDFRLEIDGVLASWAVPKGPTLDPSIRRMAVHVEDHPMEYFDFEGTIPAKQYGAGDVIVWDWGTWEPEAETPEPAAAVANGELKFVLDGQKVSGRYTLVRTSRRPGTAPRTAFEDDDGEQWLLIHKRGVDNVPGWDAEDHPRSVKSGRTNDEVKANAPAIWVSEMPAATAEIDLSAAREMPMPRYLEPMKATLTTRAFRDADWLYEIKWDGYRVEAVVRDDKVALFTRNGHDAETYFPRLLSPPTWIQAREAIVDGEVVALDERGHPDFSLLQERISEGRTGRPVPLVYQAFDLLYLDGRSLVDVPLESRKRLLELVIRPNARVQFARPIDTEGVAFFEAVKAQGLEGIVAKHRRSRYEPGRRSSSWLKVKARPEQELVVGGWTPGEGTAKDLGAVVVGVYEDERLRFAGKVGSGFDGRTRKELKAILEGLETDAPPFDPPPAPDYRGRWGGDLAGVRWIRPELVIRAELGGWTRDGHVRQTSFKGLERGRDPREVVRERAVDPAKADREADAAFPAPDPEVRPMTKAKQPIDPAWLVSDAELETLRTMKAEGLWTVAGQELKLTNLDKTLFPPRDGVDEPALTKRDLITYFARIAPAMLPHLLDRPLNLQRFPNGAGAPGFWQKDIPVVGPEVAHDLARDRLPRARGPGGERPPRRGPRRDAVLARQPGLVRDARLDVDHPRPVDADLRPDRHRPRHEHDLGGDAGHRAPLPDGARAPRRARVPEAHGQPRHPGVDPGRARALPVRGHLGVGREAVARDRRDGAQARVVGVGEGRSRRQGPARLHPERGDQDARGAVCRPAAPGCAGLRADPLGGARRPVAPPRSLDADDPARARRRGRGPVGRPPGRPPGAARAVAAGLGLGRRSAKAG